MDASLINSNVLTAKLLFYFIEYMSAHLIIKLTWVLTSQF